MRLASLAGFLLFGASAAMGADSAAAVRLWTGGGIGSDQFVVEIRADGQLLVAHLSRPIAPDGLTETKYKMDLTNDQLEQLVSLAADSSDFADGCGLVADGTSAELRVDTKTKTPVRSCKNAPHWPVGPRTKAFLDTLNALLPSEFKVF